MALVSVDSLLGFARGVELFPISAALLSQLAFPHEIFERQSEEFKVGYLSVAEPVPADDLHVVLGRGVLFQVIENSFFESGIAHRGSGPSALVT